MNHRCTSTAGRRLATTLGAVVALAAASGVGPTRADTPQTSELRRNAEVMRPGGALTTQTGTAPAAAWGETPPSAAHPPATDRMRQPAIAGAPVPKDCRKLITKPDPGYQVPNRTKFYTDGTLDHGQIMNEVATWATMLQRNLEDLQVRIEQLRCENRNLQEKVDFLANR